MAVLRTDDLQLFLRFMGWSWRIKYWPGLNRKLCSLVFMRIQSVFVCWKITTKE